MRVVCSNSRRAKAALAVPLAALFCVSVLACPQNDSGNHGSKENRPARVAQARYVMGTMLEIQLPAAAASDQLFASLFAIARRHDEIFSTFKPESPVSRFNKLNQGQASFDVPEEMAELTIQSQKLNEETDGAFDITVGPMVRLWKQAVKQQRWPLRREIQSTIERKGSDKILVDKNASAISARIQGMELDFNGIAKGYSVDKMAEALRHRGVTNALINLGESSIYALGPDRWTVEVRDPRQPEHIALKLSFSDMALGSSGSYEKTSRIAGRMVNHIIDPRTGSPVDSHKAVTVIAPSATVADALSTALVVLSPRRGLEILKKFPGAEAVIFYRSPAGRWRRVLSSGMHVHEMK